MSNPDRDASSLKEMPVAPFRNIESRRPRLANGYTAFFAVVVWKTVGFTMILLLVGMQAIPTDLYEAARIDGANWWTQVLRQWLVSGAMK